MSPDVTVVVTTHDRRDLLVEAIASVRAQQGVSWELIVADDGSSDGTPEWLEHELRGPDERLLRGSPRGRSLTANAALAHAHGRHVLFLDDDDRLLPGALRTLTHALGDAPEASAALGARLREVDDRPRRMPHPARRMVHDASRALIASWGAITGQTLIRTDLARAVGGFADAFPADDLALLLRLAARGPFVFVPDAVVDYRVHAGQHDIPPDLKALRHRVTADALPALPRERRRQASTAWAAGQRRRRADALRESGRLAPALALYAGSVLTSPAVSASPLIWPSLARDVAHCGRQLIRR